MKLVQGCSYTNDRSELVMTVVKIQYVSLKGYIKFKGILSHRKYNFVYETKNYKLRSDIPKLFGWRKI